MTQHPNAELIKSMVEAFGKGDLMTVRAAFAPDAAWELPGRGRLAGIYRGPDEIIGFLAKAYELSGGTLALELIDVLSSDRGAAHVQWVSAERDGRSFRIVEVLVHEISDGKIVRTYHRPDAHALDDFFG
jgi:ketosteroid isomerase-like protein